MLDFWNTILKNINIDCIVFYTWPHTPTCYSLYLMAKYVFKKKILFIDVIEHFDNFYHTVGYQIEDFSLHYSKHLDKELNNEDVNNYINNIKNNKKYKRSDHLRWKELNQKFYALKIIFLIFKSMFKLSFLKIQVWIGKMGKKISALKTLFPIQNIIFKLKMSLLTSYYSFNYKKNVTSLMLTKKIAFCLLRNTNLRQTPLLL